MQTVQHVASERLPASERRERLIQGFIDEALACGSLAGVSVRAVCERAGCTAPVLYRIFGNRDGLERDAVASTHAPLMAQVENTAARAGRSAGRRLTELCENALRKTPGEAEAFEAIANAACRSDAVVALQMRRVYRGYESHLVQIVSDGIESGEFRSDTDAVYVAWRMIDLGLFRTQAHLMELRVPTRIDYTRRAVHSLLREISA